MVQREVKKKTSVYGTVAVLSAIILVSMVYVYGTIPIIFPPTETPLPDGLKQFSSSEEIVNFLKTNSGGITQYGGGPLDTRFFTSENIAPTTQDQGSYGLESSTNDYSKTNIQVEGVDEADTVKTDGSYLYVATTPQNNYLYYKEDSSTIENSVYIIDANPDSCKVLSKITLGNNTQPAGLFLSQDGNRLVVLASKYQFYTYNIERTDVAMLLPYNSEVNTYINVYDVSNKANPLLVRNLTVSGSYFNSRMIGDYLYTVISQPASIYNEVVTLPVIYDNNKSDTASPRSIYYSESQDSWFTFTSFYALDIMNDNHNPTNLTVMMGGASAMYVSESNIYVTYPNWSNDSGQYTAIYSIGINGLDLSPKAEGSVPGNTINQYSMDEFNNYFRIATNWFSETQISNVYILDSYLKIVGRLEGLAPNENLHSVRFMDDKCYLVTFKSTDPLFVIDLSQPEAPEVLGELKIPGYSDYLHPYDQTHLIGVGKDTVETDDPNFAWYQGVKIALFDVGNVNQPIQLATHVIGDRGTDSLTLNDHKAFLFDKAKGMLVIPINLAIVTETERQQYGASAYGEMVWQGVYVFSVSLDGGFTLKGKITHIDISLLDEQNYLKDDFDYYTTQNNWITRSLYIGNTLYTVSNTQVKLNTLTDLTEISVVDLT